MGLVSKSLSAWPLFFLLLAPMSQGAAQPPPLTADDAWVRQGPPNAPVLGAYMTLHNQTDSNIVVTDVASPDFEKAQIHATEIEGGVARMIQQKTLEIPAGEKVTLKPGGLHMMLYHPKRALAQGDTLTLELTLQSGEKSRIEAAVREGDGVPMHHHH